VQVEALQGNSNSWKNTIHAWTKASFADAVGADWLMRVDPSDAWESYQEWFRDECDTSDLTETLVNLTKEWKELYEQQANDNNNSD
jgi:hypothetical protein